MSVCSFLAHLSWFYHAYCCSSEQCGPWTFCFIFQAFFKIMDMSSCRSLQQGISWLYSFKLEILMRLLDWICSIMNICFVLFADARCWKISNIFAVSEFIQSWVCLEQNVWSINKEKRPGNADRWCLFPISLWYCPNGVGSVWEIKRCNNRLSSPLDLALMVLMQSCSFWSSFPTS